MDINPIHEQLHCVAIGVNKYETPHQLLLRKCGKGPKFQGNEATRHGEKYEDEARIIYEQRHNEVVHELGLCPHPKYTFLGGSPDGVSESGKLVEIKCPMMREIKREVPEHYMPQLQLCMEILDLEEADFIQYKPADFNWPKPEEFVVVCKFTVRFPIIYDTRTIRFKFIDPFIILK